MDGVAPCRLVQGRVGLGPVEAVGAVLQAVRPRRQDLAPSPAGDLVLLEAPADRGRTEPVGTEGRPDLGHHGVLIALDEDELFAGGRGHGPHRTGAPTRGPAEVPGPGPIVTIP